MSILNIAPDIYQALPHKVTAKAADYDGGSTPMHSHPRAQLIYASSGVMRIETEYGCWIVPPLRGVWIPPEVMHTAHMQSRVQVRTLYIRADIAANLSKHCCLVEVSPLLRSLVIALTEDNVDYDETGRSGLIAQLALLEIKFLKTPALHLPLPRNPKLMLICQEMLKRPDVQVTIELIADQLAMSTRTLARKFKKETTLSFSQWRQQARLIEALSKLADQQPVAKIASDLGYLSASAFTAMFKRTLGIEPSRYFK
ncbi:helix-turn-helix transcriptional regulator [Methylophilus sp. VKM B-3414]|uniref:AraC family transcriptional regulator n=1 Tax=Methylophilus sp. VKM B-3414 TaxID=3076121 RepID=UPI0028C7D8D5|nr:helix-turn-helix transcriptional regulator [Methylophilus sp. VKM B-3414]MDT7848592.1 helix-turn-helix transcriptional regulator [Methylophilus sp. VKM B-3414]